MTIFTLTSVALIGFASGANALDVPSAANYSNASFLIQ